MEQVVEVFLGKVRVIKVSVVCELRVGHSGWEKSILIH